MSEKGALLVELDSTATGADTERLANELERQRLDVARLRSVLQGLRAARFWM